MKALRLVGFVMVAGIALAGFALPAAAVSYSQGESCPLSLHGQTTVDSSGQQLVCENKNGGWYWELSANQSPTTTSPPTTVAVTTSVPTTTPATTTTTQAPAAPVTTTTAAPATASTSSGALATTGAGPTVLALGLVGLTLVLGALAMFGGLALRRRRA